MYTKNNKDKILSILEGINPLECRRVMVDYDSFIKRVQQEKYAQALIDLFRENEKTDNKVLSDEDLPDYIKRL